MIDPIRNIALLPASVVIDRFIGSLDEVGKMKVDDLGVVTFPGSTVSDFRKHYVSVLKKLLKDRKKSARKVVFVDECLPQYASQELCPCNEFMSQDNVIRWKIDDDVDIPWDDICRSILIETRTIVETTKKAIYFANRELPEEYLLQGIRSVFSSRLIGGGIDEYMSSRWSKAVTFTNGCLRTETASHGYGPAIQRKMALDYLYSKITDK